MLVLAILSFATRDGSTSWSTGTTTEAVVTAAMTMTVEKSTPNAF